MQRWLSILLGLGVIGLAFALAANGMPPPPRVSPPDAAEAKEDVPAPAADAGAIAVVPVPVPVPGGSLETSPADHIPDNAKAVRFGVVLVTYAGAQGAPEHARSAHEAREIANKLAVDAKADFHGAVVRGDSGSIDDAGRMPRGVLDPATELKIFTMPVDTVSDPIDTPRGFWIVKRLE